MEETVDFEDTRTTEARTPNVLGQAPGNGWREAFPLAVCALVPVGLVLLALLHHASNAGSPEFAVG